jgi:isocitrate dehydrogenase
MDFKEVKIPEGDLIQYKDGELVIGDHPVIGYLRGDGIGLDITPVMRKVVDTAVQKAYGDKRAIAWCPLYAGLEGLHHYGSEFPDETVEAIRYLRIAIKGPFTTPIGEETHVCLYCAHQQYHSGTCDKCAKDDGVCERFRSINVRFRQHLDLFACVRPIRYFEGVPAPNKYADKVNFMIFRENTEDVYAGYDFESGGEMAKAIIDLIKEKTGRQIRLDSGIGVKPISVFGTQRLVRKALQWAVSQKLPSVTLVHKGNIMKFTEGSFAKWGYELAEKEFGDVTVSEKDPGQGPHRRLHLPADPDPARRVQRFGVAQPERRLLVRRRHRPRRRSGPGPRRQHERRGGPVRGHPRHRAQVHRYG